MLASYLFFALLLPVPGTELAAFARRLTGGKEGALYFSSILFFTVFLCIFYPSLLFLTDPSFFPDSLPVTLLKLGLRCLQSVAVPGPDELVPGGRGDLGGFRAVPDGGPGLLPAAGLLLPADRSTVRCGPGAGLVLREPDGHLPRLREQVRQVRLPPGRHCHPDEPN